MKRYRKFSPLEKLLFLAIVLYMFSPLLREIIAPKIDQLTKCIDSEISKQYMEFVTDQRIKRNLRESSPEWQEKMLVSINLIKQRTEEINRIFQRTKDPYLCHEYLELARYHNNLVERFQQVTLRYAHGSQYSQIQTELNKILPQKIVIF